MINSKEKIHHQFIRIASGISESLAYGIQQVGPVDLQANYSIPLAQHLCRSVASQQLSVKAARTIWNRVVLAANDVPLTEFFIEENIEVLRSCGLSAAKTKTMCGIAQMARAGDLEAADLGKIGHTARSKHLTSLWGVGQWTADMISIFYFGDEDVWPDGDLAARKTLEKLTSRRRKTMRTAARFAPYRSRLALYMWEYQDTVPI